MSEATKSAAYLSDDRRYRYWLLRVWDGALPVMANFGVNPSTADENANDPTIRKDIGFASRLGFGGLLKLNVCSFRATDPRDLRKAHDPDGTANMPTHQQKYIEQFGATKVVFAWGKNGNYFWGRCQRIIEAFPDAWCFGKNPDGTPRHTLMLPYATELVKFRETL